MAGKVSDDTWAAATKWHLWLFDVLLVVIALHIAANILYLVWKRENLVKPMITGRKKAAPFEDQNQAQVAGPVRAAVSLILAIIIVFGGITALGGKIF